MRRFAQLLEHIKQQNLVAAERLDAYVMDCELLLSGKKLSNGNICAAYKQYQAVFEISHYKGNADELLAYFASWLHTHEQSDNQTELPPPNFDIEPVNDHIVDVMVEVMFSERLELVRDDAGPYQFGEHRYRLDPQAIDVAETVEVDGEVCHE